jgi:hypothetical protein
LSPQDRRAYRRNARELLEYLKGVVEWVESIDADLNAEGEEDEKKNEVIGAKQ